MASITVKIKKEGGIKTRKVSIDNKVVPFDKDGNGSVDISGTMGDGSMHMVVAAITGSVGAKLTTTLSCEGKALKSPEVIEVTAANEPGAATHRNFPLQAVGA